MRFSTLQPGRLIRRYKRFLADVELPSGELVVAHCPNTGAMTGCADPGVTVWLSPANNPKRKLAWTLEMVESAAGLVCVHSALANTVVEEALQSGLPRGLAGFNEYRREVKYGEASRADFQLMYTAAKAMVEVKAVTLHRGGGLGDFPDAISTRAKRHVEALQDWILEGGRAALVFCVLHEGIDRVAPADDIDPEYARTLRSAVAGGLEVYALGTQLSPEGILAHRELPAIGLGLDR